MTRFQNEANAVAAWLTSEGVEFDDLVARVKELADRTYIEWHAAFEPTEGKTCEEQRENYEAFLNDAGFVDCRQAKPRIRPHHLRVYLNIKQPSGECAHTDREEPATTIFSDPEGLIHGKDYCEEHANRLANTLLSQDNGMTHAEGEMWADG